MKTEIIYEDNDILVVYKPAGLATQTAKLGQADVVSELKNYLKQSAKGDGKASQVSGRETYLGIIHRLDQPVEGLLVFAKQKKAAADLTTQLQRQGEVGSLHKHYYAVVCGKPKENQDKLVDYMYKSPENLAVIVERSDAGNTAKKAVLEYRISRKRQIAQGKVCNIPQNDLEGSETIIALADINILTGRFHQIRAQMAHAGMPLLGDAKYGSEESRNLSRSLSVQTVALCAYCLEFQHPVTRANMHFEEKPRGKAFGFFG